MTQTHLVDLQDHADELQAEIRELQTIIDRHESIAEEGVADDATAADILERIYADTSYESDVDLDELSDRSRQFVLDLDYDRVRKEHRELANDRDTITSKVDDWGGSEFTVTEFTAGREATRNKEWMQDLMNEDIQDPRAGIDSFQLRTIQVGVVSSPPETPDKPQQWPPIIAEYVYEHINNLNTYGEADIEDFSVWGSASDEPSPSN